MYERPFCPMLVFQKGTLSLAKLLLICIKHRPINVIQIMSSGNVDKSTCYGIYALVDPFIDKQPVNWLKLFAGYMMSLVQHQAKPNTLILCNLYFLF